jgi:hypothetical protein
MAMSAISAAMSHVAIPAMPCWMVTPPSLR